MWVSELMETAGLLHKNLQGGCNLGTGNRGVILGNPYCSGSGRLSLNGSCPCARVEGVVGRRGRSGPHDTCQALGKPLLCPATVWCRHVSLSGETVLQCREGNPEALRKAACCFTRCALHTALTHPAVRLLIFVVSLCV